MKNSRHNINLSYQLEERLERAAERIAEAIRRPAQIKAKINLMRRGGRAVKPVPDDVKQWFEETDDNEED